MVKISSVGYYTCSPGLVCTQHTKLWMLSSNKEKYTLVRGKKDCAFQPSRPVSCLLILEIWYNPVSPNNWILLPDSLEECPNHSPTLSIFKATKLSSPELPHCIQIVLLDSVWEFLLALAVSIWGVCLVPWLVHSGTLITIRNKNNL